MATSVQSTIETNHEDVIHDAQFDYYGKRLATCSSDRNIKIFDASTDQKKLIAELKGHDGPVWQVSWAHPQFGNILASCSYDHRVIIWREQQPSSWVKFYEYKHRSSVNAIAWAPHEFGLCLASASSDFTIKVVSFNEQTSSWGEYEIADAHTIGCNAISWAPSAPSGSLLSNQGPATLVKRLVSGGGDNKVKIWRCNEQNQWTCEETLSGHSDWVRDVAWAPNIGLPYDTIATGSQDQSVIIYTCEQDKWVESSKLNFDSVVWRVSWNLTGDILAVTTADNKVTLFKQDADQKWVTLAVMGTSGDANVASNVATNQQPSQQ